MLSETIQFLRNFIQNKEDEKNNNGRFCYGKFVGKPRIFRTKQEK